MSDQWSLSQCLTMFSADWIALLCLKHLEEQNQPPQTVILFQLDRKRREEVSRGVTN